MNTQNHENEITMTPEGLYLNGKPAEEVTVEDWLGEDNQLGIDIFNNKYRYNDETFYEWLCRVSANNKDIMELILSKKFLFGGRILANRGLDKYGRKISLSNCYVMEPPEDNLESIFDCAKYLARTYSYGGGCGVDISKLAPRGAKINNAAKMTSGAVSFMDLYSLVTGLIGQNGRRGALMISMDVSHPDIEEFIGVKNDLERCTKANISIKIDDKFIAAVTNDTDYELTYTRKETGEEIKKTIRARDLFRKFAENNWNYAEPGMLYWDRVKDWNLLSEDKKFSYAGTNPCVTGDTPLLTEFGYIPIAELVGYRVNVWNGFEWSEVEPRVTGVDQDIVKMEFSDGTILKCTPYHKFILADGTRKEAKDLTPDDELMKHDFPLIDKCAYTAGYKASTDKDYKVIQTESSMESRLNWLAGYIDANGILDYPSGKISIESDDIDLLYQVKLMLNTLGCGCDIYPIAKDDTEETYKLALSSYYVTKLIKRGLRTYNIPLVANTDTDTTGCVKMISRTPMGKADFVFCATEHKRNSMVFNGIMTSNCAEEALPAGGSCLLGSLNLSAFVRNNGKEMYFDFEDFAKAVKACIKALNDVLDEGLPLHPLKIQRDSVKNWRQIGLGVMGIADMLTMLGVRYGSKESLTLCDTIASTMVNTAIATSAKLASEFGKFPKCNKKAIMSSEFFKYNTDDHTKKLVAEYGLRNSQLLTIAPTGTLSTMIGISGGIEPIFANYYTRTTQTLHGEEYTYKVYTPIVKRYMDLHNIENDEDLPDYFVTAPELDYKERLDMQATWQSHIDASISSTVNVPHDFTVEETEDLYLYGYYKGLKGVTIFRDGCARVPVLSADNPEDETDERELVRGEILPVSDNLIGLKRTLQTGCGTLHVNADFDPVSGELRECYLSKGSTGGCNNFMIGLSRMISLSSRGGIPIEKIIDQLNSTGVCPSYHARKKEKHDTSKGTCCPMAVGNALWDMYVQFNEKVKPLLDGIEVHEPKVEEEKDTCPDDHYSVCPECGKKTLTNSGGCVNCLSCGYTKCD